MLCVTIVAALVLRSYWAIWIGALISAIWSTSAVWYANDWRPSHRVRLSDATSLFKFGLNVTGANMLSFAVRNIDNILIAKVWGAAALGLYDRAYKIMLFPLQNLSRPLGQVFVPILSRLVDQPERYRRAYLTVLRMMCLAMIPGAITAAATAGTLIPLLLGQQWIAAAPIFFWLSLTMITQPVGSTNQWLFLSTGRAHLMLRWTMVGAPTSIAAFAIGVAWGPEGVAAAFCVASFLKLPFLIHRFTDSTSVSKADVYRPLIVTTIGAIAGLGLLHLAGGMAALSGVPFIMAVALIAYLGALATTVVSKHGRSDLLFTVSQLRGARYTKGTAMRLLEVISRRRTAVRHVRRDPDVLRALKPEAESRIPATDMIQAAFDRPLLAPAQTLLLILSTGRSGSTLLCEQLAALDYCYAHEYFQASQYMQILSRRWDFTEGGTIDWERFVAALRANRTAENGVLAINLHARHLALFERSAKYFADLDVRHIHVIRRDPIAQAISFDEARQTSQWSTHFDAEGQAEYDYERIARLMAGLQEQNARIAAFLSLNAARAETVVYENLVAAPYATLRAVTGLDERVIAERLARKRATMIRRQGGSNRKDKMRRFAEQFLRDTDGYNRT